MNKHRFKREKDLTRINEDITTPEIRVVDTDGAPLGLMDVRDAIQRALDVGLDLVEIAPKAKPPVCRIMDYGKFKYEKSKKEKEAKKKQHVMHLKEIKFHPKTETHDYDFKMKNVRKFLLNGDRVKTTVVFRGREIVYKDLGRAILEKVAVDLADIANCEIENKMEGRNMISSYIPDKVKITAYKKALAKAAKEAAKEDAVANVEEKVEK